MMQSLPPRVVRCTPQQQYMRGELMCTSGCFALCMLVLGKKVELCEDDDATIQQQVHEAMSMGSIIQERVEKGMSQRSCMVSLADIQKHGKILLPSLGVHQEEFMLCWQGVDAEVKKASEDGHPVLLHTCDSCMIGVKQLPLLMIPRCKFTWTTCVITYDSHSVCAFYTDGRFCFFDPMTGIMEIGYSFAPFLSRLYMHFDMKEGDPVPPLGFQVDAAIMYEDPDRDDDSTDEEAPVTERPVTGRLVTERLVTERGDAERGDAERRDAERREAEEQRRFLREHVKKFNQPSRGHVKRLHDETTAFQ